ncbi:hypothetical protein Glove_365g222 [Diversispora epigaea]|uniref:Uncharacterized protein n=1 Tax=Diversispora epigaea TaxID=1348612 RepID=A0A397HF76_9GLOM|nr:hypothetical protein Glove_365g222 [Diversispora epigaea]
MVIIVVLERDYDDESDDFANQQIQSPFIPFDSNNISNNTEEKSVSSNIYHDTLNKEERWDSKPIQLYFLYKTLSSLPKDVEIEDHVKMQNYHDYKFLNS